MMATTDRKSTTEVNRCVASGSMGNEKRRNPYAPNFSNTLASITLPAVGASTCASGNHVWNGNIGTFTANAAKKAQNSQACSQAGYSASLSARISNDSFPA